jgi:hypothetical protein
MANTHKYAIVAKNGSVGYAAPLVSSTTSDSYSEIKLAAEKMRRLSKREWEIVLVDVDARGKFIPIEFDGETDCELPILSMIGFTYAKELTQRLRNGELPEYSREMMENSGKTPGNVYAVIISGLNEYFMIMPVDAYVALWRSTEEYYGPFNSVPWAIKRALGMQREQFYIRLGQDQEMTYLAAIAAKRIDEIKLSPIMEQTDIHSTIYESGRFCDIVTANVAKYTLNG